MRAFFLSKIEVSMPNIIPEQPIEDAEESFEWLTDIIESRDGGEHRIGLRSLPRVMFDYSFIAHPHNRNRYLNLLRNHLTDIWLVPDWFQAIYAGRIDKGTDTIDNKFNHVIGDKLLIYQDSEKNEVVEWKKSIVFIFTNEKPSKKLHFIFRENTRKEQGSEISQVVNNYKVAYLLSLRKCYISNAKYTTSGFNAQIDISTELIDPTDYSGTIAKNTYLGLEVLHNYYGSNESTINKDIDIVDFDIGKVTRMKRWEYSKLSRSIKFYLDGIDEINSFKEFIYRIEGKLNAFWLCDGDIHYFNPTIKDNHLGIKTYNYIDITSFKYLALFHANSITYAKVIDIADSGILTLDVKITEPVLKVSNLLLCRFNTDSVSIKYQTNFQAQSDISIIEVFDDKYF